MVIRRTGTPFPPQFGRGEPQSRSLGTAWIKAVDNSLRPPSSCVESIPEPSWCAAKTTDLRESAHRFTPLPGSRHATAHRELTRALAVRRR
ncbi:hypothetical protein ACFPRL_15265 [Pseudoclavibacter helvolus]